MYQHKCVLHFFHDIICYKIAHVTGGDEVSQSGQGNACEAVAVMTKTSF